MTDGSMGLDWETDTRDGVTLVALTLTNHAPVPRRVRLGNRLDGPVLPPRSEGVPETGWHREGYEGVVDADARLALGYACPAAATDSGAPVELDAVAPVGPETKRDGDARTGNGPETKATAALRRLGRGRPPRDAVPARRSGTSAGDEAPDRTSIGDDEDAVRDAGRDAPADTVDRAETDDVPPRESAPAPVEAWLRDVEARVALAESLTDPTVPAATAALEAAGGVDAAASAVAEVEADATALRRVADRAETLTGRVEATDVPLDALRRLA